MSHSLDLPRAAGTRDRDGLTPPERESVLLIAPSSGLGGGIERYLSTVEVAFQIEKVPYRRLNLIDRDGRTGVATKLRFVRDITRAVWESEDPVRLVVAHNNLLPVVDITARFPAFNGATVILYGTDIWKRRRVRGRRTMRRADVRVVTISNFSAGALARACPASVLRPGVTQRWYDTLIDAGTRARRTSGYLDLVTAFRLEAWRDKGLPALLHAARLLNDERVRLTVCGAGPVPAALRAEVAPYPWCRIAADLTDDALADQLAGAHLFVLATRTRYGPRACGEGFGLVLLEAQIAGTPVVAPAFGGSGDAFQADLTGLAPIDESPEALARVLATLLWDAPRRVEMGRAAAAWSRTTFEPTSGSRHVVETLVGR